MSFYYPTRDRDQLRNTAAGIVAETWLRNTINASSASPTQEVQFGLVGLRAGDVVTSISIGVVTNGATLSLAKVGVYSAAGVLLASSDDFNTALESGAIPRVVTTALTAPYTVTADGGYYLAFLQVGSTATVIWRGASASGSGLAVGSGVRPYAKQTGQADLPASATLANADVGFWMAAS